MRRSFMGLFWGVEMEDNMKILIASSRQLRY